MLSQGCRNNRKVVESVVAFVVFDICNTFIFIFLETKCCRSVVAFPMLRTRQHIVVLLICRDALNAPGVELCGGYFPVFMVWGDCFLPGGLPALVYSKFT